MPSDPREILRRWLDGVNRADRAAVLELYAADAEVLATFSTQTLSGSQQIENYFHRLTADSAKVVLDESSVMVRALGGSGYVLSGHYAFHLGGGQAAVHPARFTFVMDMARARPIVHHHSSPLPEIAD